MQVIPFIFPGWQVPVSHASLRWYLAGCDVSLPGWDGEGPGERHKPYGNSKNAAIICALTSRWLRWVCLAPSQQCWFRKTVGCCQYSRTAQQRHRAISGFGLLPISCWERCILRRQQHGGVLAEHIFPLPDVFCPSAACLRKEPSKGSENSLFLP